MWKADFGAIDGTVPCALDDGEEVMIFGIEDDALDGGLWKFVPPKLVFGYTVWLLSRDVSWLTLAT